MVSVAFAVSLTVSIASSGCLALEEGPENLDVASSSQTVVVLNALSKNAMSANAMSANAMSANAMSANGLEEGVFELDTASAGDLYQTALGRQFLKYNTRCAYSAGDELEVPAYDSFPVERLPGNLGLANIWKTGGLTAVYKRMMSACLLAHLNNFGISVSISVRFPGSAPPDATETDTYWYGDAVFFGDVFADPAKWYACSIAAKAGSPTASSPNAADRVCDEGNCNVIQVADPCHVACDTIVADGKQWKFSGCLGPDGIRYDETFTVWLQGTDAPTCEPGDVGITCKPE
jgi:hypothetical protein